MLNLDTNFMLGRSEGANSRSTCIFSRANHRTLILCQGGLRVLSIDTNFMLGRSEGAKPRH